MKRDHRDLVIETLADSEAELLDRVRALEEQIAWWRSCVFSALDVAAQLQRELDLARHAVWQLRDAARPQRAAA